MKLATFVLAAGCWVFAAGCGSSNVPPGQPDPAVKDFPKMGQAALRSPGVQISGKTPQEQAEFLRNLGTDPTFDPKKHVIFLEEYSKKSDPDVAAAAKALLDRAK